MLKLKQVERDKRATCPIVPNKWLRQSLRHLDHSKYRSRAMRYLLSAGSASVRIERIKRGQGDLLKQ